MVKFQIGFTIDAETLFSYVSRLMPGLEDLHIQEVYDTPPVRAQTVQAITKPENVIKIPKVKLINKPEKNKRGGNGILVNLEKGGNKVIMDVLSDGLPHKYFELKRAMDAAGFAQTGIGAKLSKLKEYGVIFQPSIGQWQKKA